MEKRGVPGLLQSSNVLLRDLGPDTWVFQSLLPCWAEMWYGAERLYSLLLCILAVFGSSPAILLGCSAAVSVDLSFSSAHGFYGNCHTKWDDLFVLFVYFKRKTTRCSKETANILILYVHNVLHTLLYKKICLTVKLTKACMKIRIAAVILLIHPSFSCLIHSL